MGAFAAAGSVQKKPDTYIELEEYEDHFEQYEGGLRTGFGAITDDPRQLDIEFAKFTAQNNKQYSSSQEYEMRSANWRK